MPRLWRYVFSWIGRPKEAFIYLTKGGTWVISVCFSSAGACTTPRHHLILLVSESNLGEIGNFEQPKSLVRPIEAKPEAIAGKIQHNRLQYRLG